MTKKDDTQLHPDDEIVTLSDDGSTAETKKPATEKRAAADDDDEEDQRREGGDDADEDERHGRHADDGDEDRRIKRREARRARKTHRREREAAKDAELAALREQMDTLRSQVGTVAQSNANQTLAIVDGRISEASQAKELADTALADALAKQDAAAVKSAMDARDIAANAISQLTEYKTRFKAVQSNQAAAQSQQGPGAAMINYARQFKADNAWVEFDVGAADADSQAVHRLDASVRAAGYDPNTPEYWEELQDRVDRKFPAKLRAAAEGDDEDDDTGGATQRSAAQARAGSGRRGPAMSGGRSLSGLGKNDVVIPKEVKQAAQEAGYWKDPKDRADFIKRWKASKEKYGAQQ